MNNSQKGFVVPLIIALVVLLLAGGVTYVVVKNKASSVNSNTLTTVTPTPEISNNPAVRPALSISVPKGGESFTPGQVVAITWAAPGYELTKSVNIYLLRTDETASTLLATNVPNNGRYAWTVPSTTKSASYVISVHIPDGDGNDSIDNASAASSGWFTITATAAAKVSVSIDRNSLTSTSAFPIITGSASNVSSLDVHIQGYLPAKGEVNDLYAGTVPVVNGRWSFTPSASNAAFAGPQGLSSGSYSIVVGQSSASKVVTGTLTVNLSSQVSIVPDISIVSPVGGEIWQAGSSQSVKVSVSGDPCKVGNYISISLTPSNPINGNQVEIGAAGPNPSGGIQTIPVTISSTQMPGKYYVYTDLSYVPPVDNSGDSQRPVGCQLAGGLQAYDYSANYITISPAAGSATIVDKVLPDASVNALYQQTINTTGFSAPGLVWSVIHGSLPPGITLDRPVFACIPEAQTCDTNKETYTATVHGFPTTPGAYSFTIQATNGSQTATDPYFFLNVTPNNESKQGMMGTVSAYGCGAPQTSNQCTSNSISVGGASVVIKAVVLDANGNPVSSQITSAVSADQNGNYKVSLSPGNYMACMNYNCSNVVRVISGTYAVADVTIPGQ